MTWLKFSNGIILGISLSVLFYCFIECIVFVKNRTSYRTIESRKSVGGKWIYHADYEYGGISWYKVEQEEFDSFHGRKEDWDLDIMKVL